jgi:hypothetical protein
MGDAVRLRPHAAGGAAVEQLDGGVWRLSMPAGPGSAYRLAQLDDYARLSRSSFPWRAPLRLRLRARVENGAAAGTWGVGWWNDPFGMGLSLGGGQLRFPTLPNAAWFFYASAANHLAFRDGHPAQGFLAATFSARSASLRLAATAAVTPAALVSAAAGGVLRRLLHSMVAEDAVAPAVDTAGWHAYELTWQEDAVAFAVDGSAVYRTPVSPVGPLGLVLWIDNQYAALPPGGRLRFGNLPTASACALELADCTVERP